MLFPPARFPPLHPPFRASPLLCGTRQGGKPSWGATARLLFRKFAPPLPRTNEALARGCGLPGPLRRSPNPPTPRRRPARSALPAGGPPLASGGREGKRPARALARALPFKECATRTCERPLAPRPPSMGAGRVGFAAARRPIARKSACKARPGEVPRNPPTERASDGRPASSHRKPCSRCRAASPPRCRTAESHARSRARRHPEEAHRPPRPPSACARPARCAAKRRARSPALACGENERKRVESQTTRGPRNPGTAFAATKTGAYLRLHALRSNQKRL